jgi:FtsH-binding integral membrane protein
MKIIDVTSVLLLYVYTFCLQPCDSINLPQGLLQKLLFKGIDVLGEKIEKNIDNQLKRKPIATPSSPSDKIPPKHGSSFSTRDYAVDFLTRSSRQGFLRRVYSIFAAQMSMTIVVAGIVMNDPRIANYFIQNWIQMSLGSLAGSTLIVGLLTSNSYLRQTPPFNIFFLGIHTFLQSVVMGILGSFFDARAICLGTIHTLVAFLVITAYTFQPNNDLDLSTFGNFLMTSSACFLVGSVLDVAFKFPVTENILSGVGAVLFATYLAYDTRRVVEGQSINRPFGQRDAILTALTVSQDAVGAVTQVNGVFRAFRKRKEEYSEHNRARGEGRVHRRRNW